MSTFYLAKCEPTFPLPPSAKISHSSFTGWSSIPLAKFTLLTRISTSLVEIENLRMKPLPSENISNRESLRGNLAGKCIHSYIYLSSMSLYLELLTEIKTVSSSSESARPFSTSGRVPFTSLFGFHKKIKFIKDGNHLSRGKRLIYSTLSTFLLSIILPCVSTFLQKFCFIVYIWI